MKLTTRSEYALLALIHIARNQGDGFVKVEEICEEYGLSKKYLEQFLAILKQSHFVQARRGAAGGFRLAKPADDISLAEIIRLMDGPLAATESASQHFFEHSPFEKEVKLLNEFKDLRTYIATRLENLTLADMV